EMPFCDSPTRCATCSWVSPDFSRAARNRSRSTNWQSGIGSFGGGGGGGGEGTTLTSRLPAVFSLPFSQTRTTTLPAASGGVVSVISPAWGLHVGGVGRWWSLNVTTTSVGRCSPLIRNVPGSPATTSLGVIEVSVIGCTGVVR